MVLETRTSQFKRLCSNTTICKWSLSRQVFQLADWNRFALDWGVPIEKIHTYLQQITESRVKHWRPVTSPIFTSRYDIIHIYKIYIWLKKHSASFKMYNFVFLFFGWAEMQWHHVHNKILGNTPPQRPASNALKHSVYWKSNGSNSQTVFNLWSSSNLI